MKEWEYELRSDIFSAFLANNKRMASALMWELIGKKSGGLFYRYRPLDLMELTSLRFDQMYFCRAIRFDNHGDGMIRFKSYVTCFTDKKNSLTMWNDYANAAKGICMEYSYDDIMTFAQDNNLFFAPVRYSDKNLEITDKVSSVMSMMSKPKVESDEYEWRLWKIDLHSTDIGKIMAGISPRKIYIGRNADDEELINELYDIGLEKDIEIIR